jgi:hypothetical protein
LNPPHLHLSEQAEIVRRAEAHFAFADHFESRLPQARAATGRLTPARSASPSAAVWCRKPRSATLRMSCSSGWPRSAIPHRTDRSASVAPPER